MKDQEECQVHLELTQYKQRPYHRIQVKPEVWVASQLWSETLDKISTLLFLLHISSWLQLLTSSIQWLFYNTLHDYFLAIRTFLCYKAFNASVFQPHCWLSGQSWRSSIFWLMSNYLRYNNNCLVKATICFPMLLLWTSLPQLTALTTMPWD